METRSRTRYLLRGAAVLAALGALTAPATAGASVKAPVITKVTPKSLNVGDKLIIRGKHFRVGKGRNRVLFRRSGGKSLFVKADLSTKKRMTVIIPKRLERYLPKPGGSPAPAVFRLRVLTKKLSRHFTSKWNSPVVGPSKPKVVPPPVAPADGDCDGDGVLNSVETDDDDDLLPDTLEKTIGTDPCNGDTDGDGVGDGFEYQSAIDLNGTGVPSRYKLPYPNALQKDAGVDYDGDGLSLGTEYSLWKYSIQAGHAASTLNPLYYSDGTQHSHGTVTDDERDEDGDGLTNWDEINGRMTTGFWTACYSGEGTYPVPFAGTSPVDADSDADGILDGADDQDHDGLTNLQELSRSVAVAAVGGTHADQWGSVKCQVASGEQANALDPQARVNPFNPCLPDKNSPTCERHPAFGTAFAPFDANGDKYLVLN